MPVWVRARVRVSWVKTRKKFVAAVSRDELLKQGTAKSKQSTQVTKDPWSWTTKQAVNSGESETFQLLKL